MCLTHIVLVQKRHKAKVHAGYKIEEVERSIRNKTNKHKTAGLSAWLLAGNRGTMYSEFEKRLLHKHVENMQKNKRLRNDLGLGSSYNGHSTTPS